MISFLCYVKKDIVRRFCWHFALSVLGIKCFFSYLKPSHPELFFWKHLFWKVLRNLRDNICIGFLFLLKFRLHLNTRGHLCQSLFFNKSLLKKENLAQVLSCEFCEISKNTFLQNTSGRLLLFSAISVKWKKCREAAVHKCYCRLTFWILQPFNPLTTKSQWPKIIFWNSKGLQDLTYY